jgi:signal transduction histidine kinase
VTSLRLHLDTLVARDPSLPHDKRHEFYGVMLEDTDRLMQTIDKVLSTGRAGRTPLTLERHDLRALASECVEFTRTRRHLGARALRVDPGEPVDVLGDREELRGAIINLLDNAVKFSGDLVDVDVRVTCDGQRVRLSVRDRGPGLPPDEARRIFRRFYRVPGPLTQRIKGTGLGLFLVRSAARRHGGRAWAESAGPGTGATFWMELPAAPAGA